jgi:rhodanese-related sulfurtransferase
MSIKMITPQDLYQRMKLGHNVIVIDIRSPRDYEKGHIPGATSYPLDSFDVEMLIHKVCVPFPEKPTIYITSATGDDQTQEACHRLEEAGYEYITSVKGGMKAWVKAGLPRNKMTPDPSQAQHMSLHQQIQITIGSIVILGTLLGTFVNTGFLAISLIAGVGYVYEGVFQTDYLKQALLKMPWNQESTGEPSFFKNIHWS